MGWKRLIIRAARIDAVLSGESHPFPAVAEAFSG